MTGYPWNENDELHYYDINAAFGLAFAQAQASLTAAAQALALTNGAVLALGPPRRISVTLNWPAYPVAAGTYVLSGTLPYDLSVVSLDAAIGSNGGAITAQFRANGVTLGNLSGVLVTAPNKTNTIAVGGPTNPLTAGTGSVLDVVVTVTSGTPTDTYLCLNCLRTT